MNWQDTLAYIESPRLDAELNLASGTTAFFRRVGKEAAVQGALQMMTESGWACEEVLGRIRDLSNRETNLDYQNPNDTPLAILLWLTYFTVPHFAQVAAHFVDGAPRCWHAKRLAQGIIHAIPSTSTDSWENFGVENLPSRRSSADADSFTTVWPASRYQGAKVPLMEVGEYAVLGPDRQVSQWGPLTGQNDPGRMQFASHTGDQSWDPTLNTNQWYSAQD